jgi:hypothetical protein
MSDTPDENTAAQHIAEMQEFHAENQRLIKLSEGLVTPMMEVKRREWVGLTGDEIEDLPKGGTWWETIKAAEAILREKNK